MRNLSIARRYARALVDVTAEAGSFDRVLDQMETFARLLQDNAELRDVLMNPAYTRAQQTAVVDGLIRSSGNLDPQLVNLLRLLVDRNRISYLPDIARIFRELADARAGRIRGKVTSAVPLQADAVKRIEQALERLVQRDVILETKVDPALLGGVSAQVGSFVYDGSLRSQLSELRRTLQAR